MDYSKLSASDGTGEAVVANIENDRIVGATTIDVDNVDNWPNSFIFVTGTKNPNNYISNASMTIGYGHLDAGNIVIDSYAPGYTDIGNTAGQIVVIKPNTEQVNQMVALARVSHKDNGEIKTAAIATSLNAPQGFLLNGKIARTVATNNLTVAIKTLAGTDPTTDNPVYVRIGDTIRAITTALSVTKNAGTNWCNAGTNGLATFEIDYFVYLGYNTVDGVVIGFSRIPYATTYNDFNTTPADEKYAAISTITNATTTDEYEVVGRFNATLSASALYNWSVPATSVIVNRPIFTTRRLSYSPVYTNLTLGNGTSTGQYIINGRKCNVQTRVLFGSTTSIGGTAISLTSPMKIIQVPALEQIFYGTVRCNDNGVASYTGLLQSSGVGHFLPTIMVTTGTYSSAAGITTTAPHTWGTNDEVLINADYPINLT